MLLALQVTAEVESTQAEVSERTLGCDVIAGRISPRTDAIGEAQSASFVDSLSVSSAPVISPVKPVLDEELFGCRIGWLLCVIAALSI